MASKRILSLALAAALLTLTACGGEGAGAGSSSEGSAPAGVAVQVAETAASTISAENKVSGRVEAETQTSVMVGANAQCTAVYVEVGDSVQAGDPICTLDLASTLSSYNAAVISRDSAVESRDEQAAVFDTQISQYDTQTALLNGQMELTNTQIEMAEKNVRDLKALLDIGAAAQIEVDQAQLSLDQAKLGLDQAKSELAQLELAKMNTQAQRDSALAQLDAGVQSYQANVDQLSAALKNVDSKGNLVAPVSGTIISLSAVKNGFVAPSAPVAVIDGVEQLQVSVSVSEALVPKIKAGDEVDVAVSAADTAFTGTIRSVDKSANLQTKLYDVSISIPADVSGLLSGMFADVTFRTETSADTIVVPTEAILTSGGIQYVYVVEDGAARYIEVTTGLSGNGVTEVTSGLTAGQQLVTVGQAYLSDGDPVRIVSGGEG